MYSAKLHNVGMQQSAAKRETLSLSGRHRRTKAKIIANINNYCILLINQL